MNQIGYRRTRLISKWIKSSVTWKGFRSINGTFVRPMIIRRMKPKPIQNGWLQMGSCRINCIVVDTELTEWPSSGSWTPMLSNSETTCSELSRISSNWLEMSAVNDTSGSDVRSARVRSYKGVSLWRRKVIGTKVKMTMPATLRVISVYEVSSIPFIAGLPPSLTFS